MSLLIKDCTTCKYRNLTVFEDPCYTCNHAIPCPNKYEPIGEIKDNNYLWDRVNKIARDQRIKGLKEYGHGLEADNADLNTRLIRIEEELIDALMYIEHLKEAFKSD